MNAPNMPNEDIVWTVLPNGVSADGKRLRLSIVVSPRMTGVDTVGDSVFHDWPARTLDALTFRVQFKGGPTVTATPPAETAGPSADSGAWSALFPGDFPVNPYTFTDLSHKSVRSFPTRKVVAYLTKLYQDVAVNSPEKMPSPKNYGFDQPPPVSGPK